MTGEGSGVAVDTATLGLKADADEITHLVCCRDQKWGVAFCGYVSDTLNMGAEHFCSMCVAEVARLMPDVTNRAPRTVRKTGNRAPRSSRSTCVCCVR
jgi:hypothetical protein